GIFDNNPPKPIGTKSKGSKPLRIARYNKTRHTRIITTCPGAMFARPLPAQSFNTLSMDAPLMPGSTAYRQQQLTYRLWPRQRYQCPPLGSGSPFPSSWLRG